MISKHQIKKYQKLKPRKFLLRNSLFSSMHIITLLSVYRFDLRAYFVIDCISINSVILFKYLPQKISYTLLHEYMIYLHTQSMTNNFSFNLFLVYGE